ncbi:MAG: DUF4956 domain-containing protein [Oscillospiraceae bacterium]|nr:DUF4956 domain-containing protein [Oscillospiraceae bacterium]
MTFSDVFKSSFLANINSFSTLDVLLALGLAFVIGLFIFLIYKKTYRGVMYSDSFGISLIAMSMITSLVIISVTSNVVLSLGMVGALSIVRFRTAIKEPMDIAFLFWAIAVGIVLGAGLLSLAVIGSVMIGVIIVLFSTRKIGDTPYILVVSCSDKHTETAVCELLNQEAKKNLLKSKSVNNFGIELTFEVRIKNDDTQFVNQISALEGITNAVLVSYNGEYLS